MLFTILLSLFILSPAHAVETEESCQVRYKVQECLPMGVEVTCQCRGARSNLTRYLSYETFVPSDSEAFKITFARRHFLRLNLKEEFRQQALLDMRPTCGPSLSPTCYLP